VGTANTWFANVTIGARSSPQSICRPAGAPTATTAAARFSAGLAAAAAGVEP
jgi:hypothetical protein